MNRAFLGIWIPREIWLEKRISIQEKCLWAEIQSLSNNDDSVCYASNEYLMDFLGVKERRLQEMLANLKEKGLIVYVSFDGRTRSLKAVIPNSPCENDASQGCGKVQGRGAEKCTSRVQKSAPSPYIENKEENKDKNIAQPAPPLRQKPIDISFSPAQREFIHITDQDFKDWKEIYPLVDINAQLKEMIQWLLSNPSKANGRQLWRKFITNWLKKEQVKLFNQEAYRQSKYTTMKKETLGRHTGFQKDTRPVHPSRTIDLSNYVEENQCT